MAISCTPADLAAAAKCFQCIPSEQKQWIDTYLLAVIAKGSTDPNTLALAAKCFQCIPPGMLRRIQAYLLCQIASGGGGPCPQDMQVAWTPTNTKLSQNYFFEVFSDIPQTTLSFLATTAFGFDIESTSTLTSVSFPNLQTIDPAGTSGGYINLSFNTGLTSASFQSLQTYFGGAGGGVAFTISNNPVLGSLSLPQLTHVFAGVSWDTNGITSISAPLLTTVGGLFGCQSNASLTSVALPVFLPTNGNDVLFTGCALSAASVNLVLARCVANAGYVSGTVGLNGGTNAAPSGQGIADKATLIGRGVAVITN